VIVNEVLSFTEESKRVTSITGDVMSCDQISRLTFTTNNKKGAQRPLNFLPDAYVSRTLQTPLLNAVRSFGHFCLRYDDVQQSAKAHHL
jgi:hypothetical protein